MLFIWPHSPRQKSLPPLTHWGRVTHICVSKLTTIVSDNGLSPGRRQAIIWTNAGILLIRPWGTNFNEMLIEILTLSFMKMRFKVSSAKYRPFCLGLNVLTVPWRFLRPTRTHLGLTGPRSVPCWPHELWYLGMVTSDPAESSILTGRNMSCTPLLLVNIIP